MNKQDSYELEQYLKDKLCRTRLKDEQYFENWVFSLQNHNFPVFYIRQKLVFV